jgi:hypothetical protein
MNNFKENKQEYLKFKKVVKRVIYEYDYIYTFNMYFNKDNYKELNNNLLGFINSLTESIECNTSYSIDSKDTINRCKEEHNENGKMFFTFIGYEISRILEIVQDIQELSNLDTTKIYNYLDTIYNIKNYKDIYPYENKNNISVYKYNPNKEGNYNYILVVRELMIYKNINTLPNYPFKYSLDEYLLFNINNKLINKINDYCFELISNYNKYF